MEFHEEDEEEDEVQLARAKVDREEYEIIKSSLQILEDIQMTAGNNLEEMKSEIATDIY